MKVGVLSRSIALTLTAALTFRMLRSIRSALASSVASRASSRVKPFELDARILGRELPVDFGLKVVAASLPGSDFADDSLNAVNAVNAPVQALADHDVDLNFCHVQPAAVPGGVDELEAIP